MIIFSVLTVLLFLGLFLCLLSVSSQMAEKKKQHLRIIGMGMLVLDVVLIFMLPRSAYANDLTLQSGPIAETRSAYILRRVNEADERCNAVSLKEQVVVSGGRITERPVVLCAFKESDQSWHVVRIAIMQPIPESYKSCVTNAPTVAARSDCALPYHVVTQGYHVEHRSGYGITRLVFNVSQGGEHLVVYRTRHVWFDDTTLASGDAGRTIATLREVNYTPYHPDFKDQELVKRGVLFLSRKVDEGLTDLREKRVMSKAYPNKLIADVIPSELPIAIAVIEQSDDKKFRENKQETTEAAFVEYALNGDNAFQWSKSSFQFHGRTEHAYGPMQFTNNWGTYSNIVSQYSDAYLDPEFPRGALNIGNVLKAAICLIDLEVKNFSNESDVIKLFRDDPLLGGIYPVAAYNGGHGWGEKLRAWVKKNHINLAEANLDLPDALVSEKMSCPCHMKKVHIGKGKHRKVITQQVMQLVKKVNTETPGYVEKYIFLINFLGDLGLDKE